MSPEVPPFSRGDKVEVLNREHFSIWFPAAVLRPLARRNGGADQIYVEFETLCSDDDPTRRRKEYVCASSVRPAPPRETCCYFKVGDSADVLYEQRGWRTGTVDEILENSMYAVTLGGENEAAESVAAEQWQLRVHRDWKDGSWDPPVEHQSDPYSHQCQHSQKKSEDSVMTASGIKLRIKCNRRPRGRKFSKEKLVEVRHSGEGSDVSWYAAVMMDVLRNGKLLVQYQSLKTENGIELLAGEVDASCVRPFPPEIERVNPFDHLDKVDAWFDKGWWEGYVWEVFEDMNYVVCLGSTNQLSTFAHSNLRPHQDWINNKWVAASKVQFDLPRSTNDVTAKSTAAKLKMKGDAKVLGPKFSKGMMVEATSYEEGYHGSWFTALIFDTMEEENEYVLQYQTLKTDDESELLKEKADAFNIRPCPPIIQQVDRFKMFEQVNAWYNDGWWEGLISKVLEGLKYVVYFWNTNEEIEFEHYGIRPHQEWIDGKWKIAFNESNKLPNPNLGLMKRCSTMIGSGTRFCNGEKVEVIVGDENQLGQTWYYPALILRPIGNAKYLVEFRTLKYDHATELLIHVADALCIRPSPLLQRTDRYRALDDVDAWFINGWRVGRVCKVLEGGRYNVYFETTNEILEFRHNGLRPHQDWINSTWVNPKQRE
ncbi:hypothetical protein DM860_013408 [Cuscuta australis]|uniref:Agenet domain-containing protein n=1 Tax=Cuscuta australis TaxID=267555 RepID=A0A328DTR5_9ASTE|nr:hypothetical protein DM860_013408 [Cuscuta australis]